VVNTAVIHDPPGDVAMPAASDHRVRIHVGEPVRGSCRTKQFTYTRGDLDIVPAGASDAWQTRDPSTSLVVHIPTALLQRAAANLGRDAERAGLAPRHHVRDPQIEHIAWALDHDRRTGRPSGALFAEALGLALAVHLLGGYSGDAIPVRGLSRQQLLRVNAYIDDHLDRDLSIARLADVAGLSASHLKSMFRRSTGMPVHAYVIRRRVEHARTLLRRGELPPSRIALESGFAHQSHMARWMRRLLGVTPKALMRR
jgi:AraC family transcriptional regulator